MEAPQPYLPIYVPFEGAIQPTRDVIDRVLAAADPNVVSDLTLEQFDAIRGLIVDSLRALGDDRSLAEADAIAAATNPQALGLRLQQLFTVYRPDVLVGPPEEFTPPQVARSSISAVPMAEPPQIPRASIEQMEQDVLAEMQPTQEEVQEDQVQLEDVPPHPNVPHIASINVSVVPIPSYVMTDLQRIATSPLPTNDPERNTFHALIVQSRRRAMQALNAIEISYSGDNFNRIAGLLRSPDTYDLSSPQAQAAYSALLEGERLGVVSITPEERPASTGVVGRYNPEVGAPLTANDLEMVLQLRRVLIEFSTNAVAGQAVADSAARVASEFIGYNDNAANWEDYLIRLSQSSPGQDNNLFFSDHFGAILSNFDAYIAALPITDGSGIPRSSQTVLIQSKGKVGTNSVIKKYIVVNYGVRPALRKRMVTDPLHFEYQRHLFNISFFLENPRQLADHTEFILKYNKAILTLLPYFRDQLAKTYHLGMRRDASVTPTSIDDWLVLSYKDVKAHQMMLQRYTRNITLYATNSARKGKYRGPYERRARQPTAALEIINVLYPEVLGWVTGTTYALFATQPDERSRLPPPPTGDVDLQRLTGAQFFTYMAQYLNTAELPKGAPAGYDYANTVAAIAAIAGSEGAITACSAGVMYAKTFQDLHVMSAWSTDGIKTGPPKHFVPDELFVKNVLNFFPPAIKVVVQKTIGVDPVRQGEFITKPVEEIVANNGAHTEGRQLTTMEAINDLKRGKAAAKTIYFQKKSQVGRDLSEEAVYKTNVRSIITYSSHRRDAPDTVNNLPLNQMLSRTDVTFGGMTLPIDHIKFTLRLEQDFTNFFVSDEKRREKELQQRTKSEQSIAKNRQARELVREYFKQQVKSKGIFG